jgi:uncharacterized SAM-binding protein YcdF (DUF218 family)
VEFLIEIVKVALIPGSISFLITAVVIGAILLFIPKLHRWGRWWLATLALGYLFMTTPLGAAVLRQGLGAVYPSIQNAADARGAQTIVVLGNGVFTYAEGGRVVGVPTRQTAWTVLEGARVFHLLDGATVIASGGIVVPGVQLEPEADIMALELEHLGVPRDRIVLDRTSLNTYEQSVRMETLVGRGQRMVLVTTPIHMPRAVALFRARGLDVVPSPSALAFRPRNLSPLLWIAPNPNSLSESHLAMYEYMAFAHAWGRGWLSPAGGAR